MTASTDSIFAYHIGIVVRDIEATRARYTEFLHVPRWHTWDVERAGLPTNPATAGHRGRTRISYGRTPGQTIELIQPVDGESIWSVFLRDHGEGVQHLGVWTPDLPAAVAGALTRGAAITHAILKDEGATVQVSASSPPDALIRAIDPDQIAYIEPGLGGMQIEFVGPGGPNRMRAIMGEDFDNVIASPPWQAARS